MCAVTLVCVCCDLGVCLACAGAVTLVCARASACGVNQGHKNSFRAEIGCVSPCREEPESVVFFNRSLSGEISALLALRAGCRNCYRHAEGGSSVQG